MNMIERVAIAIRNDLGVDWPYKGHGDLMETAEAAIRAMREPTLDMWDAGDLAVPVSPPADKPSYALAAWQAMIDEALKDSGK